MPQYTSEVTRGRIVGMWEAGRSVLDIADAVGRGEDCVRRWIQRFQEEGEDGLKCRPKRGQPKKTTAEQDLQIMEANSRNPFLSATAIGRELHLPVAAVTIRRRLHAAGTHHRRAARKEILTPACREDRVSFALLYISMPQDFWQTVIWTDEKVFSSDEDGRMTLWRPNNTRYSPEHVMATRRSGRISVAFWGWMSAAGVGELVQIPTRMDSEEYVTILEDCMLPTVRAIYSQEDMPEIHLVHDNSSVHTARRTLEWLNDHPEVSALQWPAKSPDLNIIEHIWAIMVREWDSQQEKTAAALSNHVMEVWDSVRRRPRICQNLVASVTNRLNEVLDNNGWWTHY